MSEPLSDELLGAFAELVAERFGLELKPSGWPVLEQSLGHAARELGAGDATALVRGLLAAEPSARALDALARNLTVGETYFFREPRSLEALERHVLPEIIARRARGSRTLRLWSAGCATGEEPYSLAICLDRLLPQPSGWQVTILATDVNPRALQLAAAGVYGEWSFRGVPAEIKERYFKRTANARFELIPRIRRMVTFAPLNLAGNAYPSPHNDTIAMDVVLCRNVLMYFDAARARQVVRKLRQALVEDGWMMVSPVETSPMLLSGFVPVNFSGSTLYRKGQPAAERPIPPMPERVSAAPPLLASAAAPPPPVPAAAPIALPAPPPSRELEPTPYEAALVHYHAGRYGEAAALLEGSLGSDTAAAESRALELLARVLANEGKLDEALAWLERGLGVNKLDAGLHYLAAMIHQERGAAGDAQAALRRVLYLDRGFVLAHMALANLARTAGQPGEARRHTANALALLAKRPPEETVDGAGGMTARRLGEIISRSSAGGIAG